MKRLLALLLCLATLLCLFAGCSKKEGKEEDPGAHVTMYLADQIYSFDPADAYQNESALKITSLLYDNLFVLGENGKVEKSLVKDYKIDKTENSMLLTLRDDCYWSDGSPVVADNVVFAWSRLLDSSASFDAAVLLYDIQNARECKEGKVNSMDDVGVRAFNKYELLIYFNENVDYDAFLYNLTSYALAPLREDIVTNTSKANDWSKSPTMMQSSGPFKVRKVSFTPGEELIMLERNIYYRRDILNDAIDKTVTPYRLIIDYSKSDEEILDAYENGELFYIGDIPFSVRSKYTREQWEDMAEITDSFSTHAYVFNQNALINGEKLFAIKEVRQALSLVIPRDDIANSVVFAEAANGLVPNGVFNSTSSSKTFRDNDGTGLATAANLSAAQTLLSNAKIDPSKYSFAISVAAYDDVHMEIAKSVQTAWNSLGFNVEINAIDVIDNPEEDIAINTGEKITGIKDDIFQENYLAGNFEVAAIDFVAPSTDPFMSLAVFATGYTGGASIAKNSNVFEVATHRSGYDSEAYNKKIDAAYAEKDLDKRAKLLHEAEDILMDEMPITPIVFNENAVLQTKQFKTVKYNGYNLPIFTKTKLKNYEDFIPTEAEETLPVADETEGEPS